MTTRATDQPLLLVRVHPNACNQGVPPERRPCGNSGCTEELGVILQMGALGLGRWPAPEVSADQRVGEEGLVRGEDPRPDCSPREPLTAVGFGERAAQVTDS